MQTGPQSDERLWVGVDAHARSVRALLVAFVWALAEATTFFVVPDVYLGLVALFNPRRLLPVLISALIGAALGGFVMFAWAHSAPGVVTAALARVPLVSQGMVDGAFRRLGREGLPAMLDAPWLGMPYKVYAAGAGVAGASPVGFVVVSVLARLERFLPAIAAAAAFGLRFRQAVRRHARLALSLYGLVWVVVYLAYYVYVVGLSAL
jgi:membrane protein YqaA with SNARE-associated domain